MTFREINITAAIYIFELLRNSFFHSQGSPCGGLFKWLRPLKPGCKIRFKTSLLILVILFTPFCGEKKDDFRARLNYKNNRYSFAFTFPEKWINYAEFEIEEIIDPDIKVNTIIFTLPTRSRDWQPVSIPAGYAGLFSVRVFNSSQWDTFVSRYGNDRSKINSSDRKLAERNGHVYMIKYATSIPVDLYLFMKDIAEIAGTFRFVER